VLAKAGAAKLDSSDTGLNVRSTEILIPLRHESNIVVIPITTVVK
jgi:hypothetical protein